MAKKKKKQQSNSLYRTLINLILLAAIALLSIQVITLSKANQERKLDLAEINHIKYGLLNIDEWEEKIATIITNKINEFELVPENRDQLKQNLEHMLNGLINDFEKIFETRTSGKFSKFKKWVAGFALDIDELRANVPVFAETILEELNNPETKEDLKAFVLGKLDEFLDDTFNKDSLATLHQLIKKYGYNSKEDCRTELKTLIKDKQNTINYLVITIIILVLFLLIFNISYKGKLSFIQALMLVLSLACLLLSGVLIPMIELEARIDLLLFQLIGEEIAFKEQIFFFQSKSIINVVGLLWHDQAIQMKAVGGLIFTFSVLFPSMKLVCSLLYKLKPLQNNSIVKFFVLKSGKWSMADVMVVAIFMAYIGFNGVVSSQLNNLSEAAKPVEIFSTNGTQLVGGFYLFLMFCISSLLLSEALVRKK